MRSSDRALIYARKLLIHSMLLLAGCLGVAPASFSYNKVVLNFTTADTPAAAVYNSAVFTAFTGMDAQVYPAESTYGVDFGSP